MKFEIQQPELDASRPNLRKYSVLIRSSGCSDGRALGEFCDVNHAVKPARRTATAHPQPAWVIHVTGTDIDSIPRTHVRAKRDKIREKA
jgi:hypothetical protein